MVTPARITIWGLTVVCIAQTLLLIYSVNAFVTTTDKMTKIGLDTQVNSYKSGCFEGRKYQELNCNEAGEELRKVFKKILL